VGSLEKAHAVFAPRELRRRRAGGVVLVRKLLVRKVVRKVTEGREEGGG
jgi:hypothetical protein